MERRLILVVGSPRSGTSVVARNLHEMGICMGHKFPAPNDGNPLGFFEDFDLLAATREGLPGSWLGELRRVHAGCPAKVVGFKSPELAFMDMAALDPDLVFWTMRDLELTAASLMKRHNPKPTHPEALLMVNRYDQAISAQMPSLPCKRVQVDLTKWWEDDALKKWLRGHLVDSGVLEREGE